MHKILDFVLKSPLFAIILMSPPRFTEIKTKGAFFYVLFNKEKEEMFAKKYGFHGINLYRSKNGLQIILGHTKGRPEIPGRNRRKRIEQITLF